MKFILALLALTSAAKIKAHSKSTAAAGWTDSWGDGCDWYAIGENVLSCGDYDVAGEIGADEACDECPWVDSAGDGCDWYVGNEGWCDSYAPASGVTACDACLDVCNC